MTLYSGCGNTFVLIDNRTRSLSSPSPDDCSRADGVIFLENSTDADYRMRIFNSDGNETEMCGNGLRCLIRFVENLGDKRKSFKIKTMERLLSATNHGEMISIEMGSPKDIRWNETLVIDGKSYLFHHLNTGVPHAVAFMNFVSTLPVDELGSKVRRHPRYAPQGANADFAEVEDNEIVTLRTYERGVEAETLACGTGACAAALAANKVYGLKSPIAIRTKSNEFLYISFTVENEHFSDVTLTGPARLV